MLEHRELINDGLDSCLYPSACRTSVTTGIDLQPCTVTQVMPSANTRRHFKERQINRSLFLTLMESWIPL